MKRLTALLLALTFIFCGCGNFAADTEKDDSFNSSYIADSDNNFESSAEGIDPQPGESITTSEEEVENSPPEIGTDGYFDISEIPEFSGDAFVAVNGNIPYFTPEEITTQSFETYAELDSLGRCGITVACIGTELMPTEERGEIGYVKPTGWHSVRYDNVDGKYLYNRCHLIGWQLTGENANKSNLITGTRFMNVEGMLPFENMVADYIKETKNHVLYRVTPVFEGENLLASGVLMEALSVEDEGEGICFNVFCYNSQPDIIIDYATGESKLDENASTLPEVSTDASETSGEGFDRSEEDTPPETQEVTYILNTNSKKFHYPSCGSAENIADKNRQETSKSRQELIEEGYSPCGNCDP